MPKINNVHRLDRLKEILKKIKNNENVEIRDINNLLTDEQEQELKDMWTDEQANRKNKSYAKEQWQDKRALRIKLIERVIKQLDDNLLNEIEQLQHQREVKAARVFMDAYFEAADNNENKWSKANIALQRAGFLPVGRAVRSLSKRDIELRKMEENIRKRFEAEMTEEEREQLELLKETEAAEKKSKKR
jgi:6-pyruvoyl-tetrahydropterin synthase